MRSNHVEHMATKRKCSGDRQPEKRKRCTTLLEFRFVPRNDNPPSNPIRYSASLESKLAEKLCGDIVNDIVEHSLNLVTGSGSWKHPIGRPQKQPSSSLHLAGPPSQSGGCGTLANEFVWGSAGGPDEDVASRETRRNGDR